MNRILVRAPNWIGDQVLAFPFFHQLRSLYPNAWISVVCTEWVRDIQFKGLVDEVFVFPRRREDSLLKVAIEIWKFSRRLKASGPWDLAITLPNSFGAALLLYLSKAKVRRGYDTDARGFLLTQKVTWNPSHEIHRAQAYLNLLSIDGLPSFEAQNFWKESGEAYFDPIRYWPDIIPIEPPKEGYFLVAPGATAESRRWSSEQFSDFIEMVVEKYSLKAVVVGGNAEKAIALQFYRRGIQVEDYTGKGWVSAHWKLFRNARFTLCNESGLAHVAALCGSSVQIVCGAADPRRTKPIGPGPVMVKVNPVECWPCEKNACRFEDEKKNQCLKGISPQKLLEGVEREFLKS